ncbi:hypothetical protein AcV5_006710 [Taiwanofungus camphoratus]|nr:hypothetical protein AcV5_006710 [Antrodia cinnamomea]
MQSEGWEDGATANERYHTPFMPSEEAQETPSAAITVPRHRQDNPVYGVSRSLVGSPEQFVYLEDSLSTSQPHENITVSPHVASGNLRPNFGRSASSSVVMPGKRSDVLSSLHGITSSFSRRANHEQPLQREWSVFAQLLRDDDLLGTPGSSATARLRHGVRRSALMAPSPNSCRHPVSASDMHVSGLHESVQSPVSDPRLSDPFGSPAVDGGLSSDEASSQSETSGSDDDDAPSLSPKQQRPWRSIIKLPTWPPLYRNILKCSVAYFIASLFTFSPYLSGFIADLTNYGAGESTPSPSGHMVATVAVYYNPAKTLGGMVEADVFCFMGLLFAAFVSLSSMSMFWFFEVKPGLEWLADSLVLLWIGLGMSAVAWMKVWMAKPTFNTACSMTAIILFIVVVKEGGLQTLSQVSFIVLVGALISNLVCALLWPQRATKNLQDAMTKTLQSFATLLEMLTTTFLLEEPLHHLSHQKLQHAAESHQASFTSLKKNLVEAQSEWMFGGPSKASGGHEKHSQSSSGQAYQDAIDSLNRLGQHLNGLRSGTTLQFELIKAERSGKVVFRNRSVKRHTVSRFATLEKGKMVDGCDQNSAEEDEGTELLQTAAIMFGDMMDDLGPPLKALSTTCITTLARLRDAFMLPRQGVNKDDIDFAQFQQLADSIERALFTFESTSNHAVLRLYRNRNASGTQSRSSVSSMIEENHILTGGDGENVFLVYFFIFTLQEFAKELVSLVDAMQRICNIEKAHAARQGVWKRLASISCSICSRYRHSRPREKHQAGGIRKRLSTLFVDSPLKAQGFFPKIKPHAPNTTLTPARSNLSYSGRVKQSIWALGARLKEQDIKYAIKVGMATALLASPAFFDSTRPMFIHYRGEWALISFFVVISPTIGATNFLGVHRVLGTLLGAATAAAVWTAFPENPYALSAFGFFFSIPCFYYIVAKPQYAVSSRFVLLTYNLTCLYCYNLRERDVAVTEIAFHRAVAVTIGVVWAAVVSRYWWPMEARRALSKGLGEFCLNMGWLYTRLVAFNSFADTQHDMSRDQNDNSLPTETTSLLQNRADMHLENSIRDFMAMYVVRSCSSNSHGQIL